MKTSETKKLVKIFCEVFLIFKNILLKPSRTYFHLYKKGFLNSQTVRIRVMQEIFYFKVILLKTVLQFFVPKSSLNAYSKSRSFKVISCRTVSFLNRILYSNTHADFPGAFTKLMVV
jgi:hypothetical protein